MPYGIPRGAMCVQRFDNLLNSAIYTTFRISLRSSSMPEPRDPLLKVVIIMQSLLRKQIVRKRQGFRQGLKSPRKLVIILPQVYLQKPCYDFYFL
ncbi:hypothetical protein K460DRAFT_297842 [Cucurbitaria berberidis CBS 394.84]|uniref:Uncharacterized protein n=1 Tax=Cucurbitaria berberidis CBS 394.84 TaxID=1168544 RepID=A0A9P4G6F1_9PLEO|nr:hypothetical protein K460DRAFT_297842 [Cucurbitaria berberidis CBS 394.84]